MLDNIIKVINETLEKYLVTIESTTTENDLEDGGKETDYFALFPPEIQNVPAWDNQWNIRKK